MDRKSGHIFWIMPSAGFFFILCLLSYVRGFSSSNDEISRICAARCSGFTGQAYVRCIETCVRTTKRTRPVEEKSVSQRMKECEEICAVYDGVDRVKCLRLCLDKNKAK